MKTKKPRVLVIGTGGTISAKRIGKKWKYGALLQEDLIKLIPDIKNKFNITTKNIFRMDSSDMKPEHWLTLAKTIYYNIKDYDGIVITIGRDTIHYADTAIAFLIQNLSIPIVFTASLYNPEKFNTDALNNLKQAITVAGKANIAETVIVLDNTILRATRTKKVNSSEFNSFAITPNSQIGKIQSEIELIGKCKKRKKRKSILFKKLETEIAILMIYPGFYSKRITNLIDAGVKGIILQGYGFGNLPFEGTDLKESIKYANKKNVPIILTSECFLGDYWKKLYPLEIGDRFKNVKIIPAYDMLTETAYVKLMWALGQTNKYPEIKKIMQTNYCGEINKLK